MRAKRFKCALAAILVIAASGIPRAEPRQTVPVRIEFSEGRVTIAAKDARATAILEMWGRIGGTEIAGADALGDRRVTVEVTSEDEEQALRQIVGEGFGFAGNPRSATIPGASRFVRVTVVAARAIPHAHLQPSADLPEARSSFAIPDRAWPLSADTAPSPAPITRARGPLPDPETVFDYSRPRLAVPPAPDSDLAAGLRPSAIPQAGAHLPEPETRFGYSVPGRVQSAVKQRQQGDSTSVSDPPAAAGADPESRFHYFNAARTFTVESGGPAAAEVAAAPADDGGAAGAGDKPAAAAPEKDR